MKHLGISVIMGGELGRRDQMQRDRDVILKQY